ncbi:ABC transporter ATP-binding protein [Aquamicrobium soli]|uniref:ABC transporter ATP-binding protein n=1 Tax=Aquamicrobium soli TaxID=1811518 RepID=A0ABV7K8I8_9HYPH
MLEIKNLRLTYAGADAPAIDNLSLSVPDGTIVTLLGESGCGKTSTLRSVAGLETPDSGEIFIGGQAVFSGAGAVVPPYRRQIGMVFQSYAIWPHKTVFENVAYGLRSAKEPRTVVVERTTWALSTVGLGDFAQRSAALLSGGQQQRVALARALATRPRLLLLDEPLSNLDAKLREQMRFELRRILKDLGITAIYVTHDQEDAFVLSDMTALMNRGRIEQLGAPNDIYQRPATRFVAEFLGQSCRTEGVVRGLVGDRQMVDTPLGSLACLSARTFAAGDKVIVYVRPEELQPVEEASEGQAVSLERISLLGGVVDWEGLAGGVRLRGTVPTGTQIANHLVSNRPEKLTVSIRNARCVPA